ncbi:tetratricopeptide repeat protein [Kribbella sp. NPDC002412]
MATGLEEAARAAAVLAVRQDPGAREAVDRCWAPLQEVQPDGQRSALLVGWAYLALDDPASAWECFRAAVAYGTEPEVTGRSSLLAGLVSIRYGETSAGVAAWHRASDYVTAVLDEVDFTGDLTTQLTDELIWPESRDLRQGEPVLPRLLSGFGVEVRSRVALGLYALHFSVQHHEPAARAARQVVALGHFAAPGWLSLAEVLVSAGDKTAAADACRRAVETATAGQQPTSAILGFADGPVADVPTQAKTLLGVLQRDAGQVNDSLATLTDAARDDDPEAVFALAQSHIQAGDYTAARTTFLRAADRESSRREDVLFNLGLLAKDRRDLPDATRWFGQYVDAGYVGAPLAAAHLGELAYWLGEKEQSLRWYAYTLANTEVPELVDEAKQRTAELQAG